MNELRDTDHIIILSISLGTWEGYSVTPLLAWIQVGCPKKVFATLHMHVESAD